MISETSDMTWLKLNPGLKVLRHVLAFHAKQFEPACDGTHKGKKTLILRRRPSHELTR